MDLLRHSGFPRLPGALVLALLLAATVGAAAAPAAVRYFPLPSGSGPHDVFASAGPHGAVYYTAQQTGRLGVLEPASGKVREVALGEGSAPHGVIVGADGAAWITDGGLNAIVRVDAGTHAVRTWPLPAEARNANLNTATFDRAGRIWFTGQSGWYGRLDPRSGEMKVWRAPRGAGPYGIATTPSGDVYYASLAGNHIARVDPQTGTATVIEPPTRNQGARRVWSDSKGNVWVSYWNTGQVGRYDPATRTWREWKLPGEARAYAVYVDDQDKVWLSDWASNALVRFDPPSGRFESFASDREGARVRQIAGRRGEVWAPESGTDRLVAISPGN
jgi:virginiamycin B lyase